jgi:hypothetical protein
MIEYDYIQLVSEGARMCLVTRKPMAGLRRDDLRPFSPGYVPGFLGV